MTILQPTDLYHVGLIVDDIDAAAKRLTAVNGYGWTKPVEAVVAITTAERDYEVPFKFIYSLQAPHLELVQQVPGTIWCTMPDTAAHHLGYWVDDLATAAAGLEQAGYRQEARPAGDELSMFAYYIDHAGVRIEIVDRALFPDWPGFLEMMKA
jgi:Glyoxalase/Bleomycin resistance protein/Dioxygenase superfamily